KPGSLFSCRAGLPCIEFAALPGDGLGDIYVPVQELAPGARATSTLTVATNPKNGRFVFDAPGSYEFRWEANGIRLSRRAGSLPQSETAVVSVHVKASTVPPSEVEAFEA